MKDKLKLILPSVAIFIGILFAGYYFVLPELNKNNNDDHLFGWKFPTDSFPEFNTSASSFMAYSSLRTSTVPQGLPVRLKIPVIGVDSLIEDALVTPDGRMDVPAGSVNVAWFALGPHPGAVGSAVIGGHYGIENGVPFVFYKLDTLKVGDKVYIVDDKNKVITFQVRAIQLFDRNADASTVFNSTDGLAHLNLITCEGIWNKVDGNYPERRVVFTDLIPGENAIPNIPNISMQNISNIVSMYQTLRIGAQGDSVVALQDFLQEKGLLKISPTVAKGYYGPVTSSAVAKYQASVGLRPDGILGPLTMAKIKVEQTQVASNPSLPSTALPPADPSIFTRIINFFRNF